MAVVYQHRRLDTNEVFYIGIGKDIARACVKSNRGNHWKNVINKVGYEVDVLLQGITWEQACEVEKGLIESYGRIDLGTGQLVNMTDGGDGNDGRKFTKKHRENMSKSQIGKTLGPEHVNALSIAQIKYYDSLSKEEIIAKCTTLGMLNKKHKEESKEKTRLSLLGRTREKVKCPHCDAVGGPGAFHRYHFDNCKLK